MRRRRNDWFDPKDRREIKEYGRAAITISSQAGDHRYPRQMVRNLVARHAGDASVAFRLGVSQRWGDEPSYEVVLFNVGTSQTRPHRWADFVARARRITALLAHDLQQEAAVLETQSARGGYSIQWYENERAIRDRIAREQAAEVARGYARRNPGRR